MLGGDGARHEHERDVLAAQRLLDTRRALLEAAEEIVQLADELGHRLEEAAAGDAADARRIGRRALRDEVERELPAALEGLRRTTSSWPSRAPP